MNLNERQKIYRWTLIHRIDGRRPRWICRCDCGAEKSVLEQSLKLALTSDKGGSRSCGCLQIELCTQHGAARTYKPTPEYQAWIAAKKRCNSPRNASFSAYGGRGIRMCCAWEKSFSDFLTDMGPRPSPDHSLDRINPNGNYEPGNCRWATSDVQGKNKRIVKLYEFQGERLILREIGERLGITRDATKYLLKRGKLPAVQIQSA